MLSYARGNGKISTTTRKFLDGLNKVVTSGMPNAYYGNYVGYVDPKEPNDEARRNYWGPNLKRLKKIKTAFDPHDVLHNQQSIPPESY